MVTADSFRSDVLSVAADLHDEVSQSAMMAAPSAAASMAPSRADTACLSDSEDETVQGDNQKQKEGDQPQKDVHQMQQEDKQLQTDAAKQDSHTLNEAKNEDEGVHQHAKHGGDAQQQEGHKQTTQPVQQNGEKVLERKGGLSGLMRRNQVQRRDIDVLKWLTSEAN